MTATDTNTPETAEDDAPVENFTITSDDNPVQEAAPEPEAETPEPEADAEPQKEAAADDGAEGDKDKTPEGVLKQINRERTARRDAETRARTAEERLEELQAEREANEAAENLDANDFDTYEEFLEAKTEAAEATKSARQKDADKNAAPEAIDGIPVAEFETARDDIMDAVREADSDLADKVSAKDNPTGVVLTAPMLMAINDGDDPVGLVRHLAENPEVSEELAGMTQKRMERRLLKIELHLEAGEGGEPGKENSPALDRAIKRATKAPDPIEPGTGRTQTRLTPTEAANKGDFATYERLRAEEEAKRSPGAW